MIEKLYRLKTAAAPGAPVSVLTILPTFIRARSISLHPAKIDDATAPLRMGAARLVLSALMLAGIVLVVLGAIAPLSVLCAHVSTDYGEGWNAYWTAAAMRSPSELYSRSHVLVANNYPPLSFYANGLAGRLTGDDIVAGRIVALASLLSVAGLTGWIVFRLGRSTAWSLASSLLVLLYAIYPFGQFFAVSNPQWLGQAIMLAGVPPLIGSARKRPDGRACVASAACIVIGALVKHNQFALPLAIASWLLIRDRRAFAIWCAALAGLAVAACLALDMIYGSAIFVELLGFSRSYHLRYFLKGLSKLAYLIPVAIVGIVALRQRPLDTRWLLIAIYAGLGLVLGALEHFGAGVGDNADYDAVIGGVILCGAFLGSAARGAIDRVHAWRYRPVIFGMLLVPIIVAAPGTLTESLTQLRDADAAQAQWAVMISDVRQAQGPVLCEVLAVCFWAGKPIALDFFAYGQKLKAGIDSSVLSDFIGRKSAAILILDRQFEQHSGETRLPQPLPSLMREKYKLVRTAPMDIDELVPR